MKTVKEVLDKLSKADYNRLMYAFQHDISQVVELEDGTFLGVNYHPPKNSRIINQIGKWTLGQKGESND